jgi:hypothetical protein
MGALFVAAAPEFPHCFKGDPAAKAVTVEGKWPI